VVKKYRTLLHCIDFPHQQVQRVHTWRKKMIPTIFFCSFLDGLETAKMSKMLKIHQNAIFDIQDDF
jgi:hypothetical protein